MDKPLHPRISLYTNLGLQIAGVTDEHVACSKEALSPSLTWSLIIYGLYVLKPNIFSMVNFSLLWFSNINGYFLFPPNLLGTSSHKTIKFILNLLQKLMLIIWKQRFSFGILVLSNSYFEYIIELLCIYFGDC